MPTRQGDVSLLNDPVAQQLLHSPIPLRISYIWKDGTPRVIPINFLWNGNEIVVCSHPEAPKMKVLTNGSKVALTIDSDTFPYKALMVRGTVRTDTVEGIAPEYEQLTIKCLGEEQGQAWIESFRPLSPSMSRVFITPEWVGILDFETRFPNVVEREMEKLQAQAAT